MWSDFRCRCSDKCHQSWWTCTNFIHFCSLATFIKTCIRKRTLLIEFNINMAGNTSLCELNHSAEFCVCWFYEKGKWILLSNWMRNLIEYWFRCFFHHPKKRSGPQQEKPSQSPRINKTYYFESFLQRNLGEKGFLFYFSQNILKTFWKKWMRNLIEYWFRWCFINHFSSMYIKKCQY